jgi:hypothetical protein
MSGREMKLRFGRARHGWLPTTLELADDTLVFDVSYLPYDFVDELTAALSGVLAGPGEYVARICEEPTEHDWRFRSFDRSAVVFEVVTYAGGRGEKGEVVAKVWGRRWRSCFRSGAGCANCPAGRDRRDGVRTGARRSPSTRWTG